MDEIAEGKVFRAPYPFTLEDYHGMDEDGPFTSKSWKPGVRFVERFTPPDGLDHDSVADGAGEIILTVVSVHKPGRFPTRVFFTRRWRDPKGNEFGKTKCHICTLEKFRRLARGYAHEYEVREPAKAAA